MKRIWFAFWHWGWHGSEWPGVYFGSPRCPHCREWAQDMRARGFEVDL